MKKIFALLMALWLVLMTAMPVEAAQISRLRDAEISNGNLIDADDLDAELDQIISSFNTNDTELTSIGTGTYTFTGVKTFSSTPKMNDIAERTSGSGVTVDGLLIKDAGITFTDAGELTIATGAITSTGSFHTIDTESDGASDDLDTINGGAAGRILTVQAENGARTVVLKHNSGNIYNPAGYDISLDDEYKAVLMKYSAALSKWVVISQPQVALGASGTVLTSNGTSSAPTYQTISAGGWELVQEQTPSGVSSVDFTTGFDAGYEHRWDIVALDMASDAVGLDLRVSIDGSNFRSSAGDYGWDSSRLVSAGLAGNSNASDTEISIVADVSGYQLGDAAGEPPHLFVIKGYNLDTSDAKKRFIILGSMTTTAALNATVIGNGFYDGSTDDLLGVQFSSSVNFDATIRHYRRKRSSSFAVLDDVIDNNVIDAVTRFSRVAYGVEEAA